MEFHEKLQELRKRRGLTQEALAEALYVSRTAVSKWESGRGYPSIDSLKAIAAYFRVTVDELLSGEELLTAAEEDHCRTRNHSRDLVFGLLDLSAVSFLFIPLFGQTLDGIVQEVPLPALIGVADYVRLAYFALVLSMVATGILILALPPERWKIWDERKHLLSLGLNGLGVLLFILRPQPYAAAFLFIFLAVKSALLWKQP